MTDVPYLDQLRGDLLGAIEQRKRRLSRLHRTASVAIPVLLIAAVVAATLPGGGASALAIERQGDWIELRIADVAASQAQMQRELRDAGIDADIRLVPVTEALVGQWACIAEVADADPAGEDPDGSGPLGAAYQVRLPEVGYTPETLRIRRDFAQTTQDGRLVFIAGRAPEPGEQASGDPCRDSLMPPRPR
jgi:hypothetical protein